MRYLLAFLATVILVTSSLAQSGGMINGTRGIPQPNDPTGTTLYSTALVNSAGNAVLATTANTTVPVRIVVGGAGTSGNAVLASTGTLAPCTMDAALSSAGNAYVIESVLNNGQCHPQTATPTAGTYVIGYVHDATTTLGNTALVLVSGSIYGGGGGGGSGTVSPNNTTAPGALAYYSGNGGNTTVQPLTAAVSTTGNGINLGTGLLQFGTSLTANDTSVVRLAPSLVGIGSGGQNGLGFIASSNSCASSADVSVAVNVQQNVCSSTFSIPANTRAWIVRCVIPFQFQTGSTGTSAVTAGLNSSAVPANTTNWMSVFWGLAAGPAYQSAQVSAANANTITNTNVDSSTSTVLYTITLDGVWSNGSGNPLIYGFIKSSVGGIIVKAGASCRVQ